METRKIYPHINVKLQRPFIIVRVDISEFIYVCSFLNLTITHSSRMCTARSLLYGGVSLTETPQTETPHGQRPPDRDHPEIPLDRDLCGQRPPPWTETTPLDRDPLGQRPRRQRPPSSCDPWCMLGQIPPPPL